MFDLSKVKINKITEKKDFGEFVIEPLNPGFGHTLGNALRRVLLSSLPGGAVTYVKIAGVKHQFSTLEGMAEDVIEFILNLKKLRFKLLSDKPAKLILDVKGEKTVLGSDIQLPAGVELTNPKQVIAHLAGNKSRLSAEITVEKGVGYVMAEERQTNEIGVIPVDSQFSPVSRVNYRVDATRVGRLTNYDKLTLQVYTDGTIMPSEAVEEAAKILVDHFRLFYDRDSVVVPVDEETGSGEGIPDELLQTTIEELDLPVRVVNALKLGGIETVEQFIKTPRSERLKIKNLGAKSDDLVIEKLKEKNINVE